MELEKRYLAAMSCSRLRCDAIAPQLPRTYFNTSHLRAVKVHGQPSIVCEVVGFHCPGMLRIYVYLTAMVSEDSRGLIYMRIHCCYVIPSHVVTIWLTWYSLVVVLQPGTRAHPAQCSGLLRSDVLFWESAAVSCLQYIIVS